ncbi:2OG-Fe(II) oxygenase [Aliifodinibius sp. S!AR15-10]|uniref:2OG-Fe(II) oxygenase n=1 Tax=Aliifodinibius sp. S!AR15-10 TaxID=2950437 RepID=UPI0028705F88|nr:2OG-Fe(II) oxygenase [Aliifodinibius sp. S!AR15-10]
MDKLATDDYLVIDDFISDRLYQNIQHYFQVLLDESEFDKAAIGSSDQRKVESEIRGDFIYWLDPEKDAELSELFSLLDSVVINLKEHLFLSISDYEFHFALYPPNTRYEKHVDQFQGQSNRVISMLIYLNEDWKPGDGGELKIYRPDGDEQLIEPLAKRMVMFKSDTVEHEVMLTKTSRRSITGWLLHRFSSLKYLF